MGGGGGKGATCLQFSKVITRAKTGQYYGEHSGKNRGRVFVLIVTGLFFLPNCQLVSLTRYWNITVI